MTFYHLYTIAGLILAGVLLYRLFRCPHAWDLVDKTEMKPPIEDMRAGTQYSNFDIKWMHTRTVVLAMRCPKCGTARIYKQTNT